MQHGRLRAELVHELLDQARLADPGGTQHCQQMAGSMLHDARERCPERAQLPLAADERRIEAAGTAGRGRFESLLERAEDCPFHHPSFKARAERAAAAF